MERLDHVFSKSEVRLLEFFVMVHNGGVCSVRKHGGIGRGAASMVNRCAVRGVRWTAMVKRGLRWAQGCYFVVCLGIFQGERCPRSKTAMNDEKVKRVHLLEARTRG